MSFTTRLPSIVRCILIVTCVAFVAGCSGTAFQIPGLSATPTADWPDEPPVEPQPDYTGLDRQGELERELAVRLLNAHGLSPITSEVPIGPEVNLDVLLFSTKAADANFGAQLDAAYGAMKRLRYLSFRRQGGGGLVTYSISPTELGSRNGFVLNKKMLGYRQVYLFKLADREASAVTGIQRNSDTQQTIEFQYDLVNKTRAFKEMVRGTGTDRHAGRATALLYDDGWRITQITFIH